MVTHQYTGPRPGEIRILTFNVWGRNGAWSGRRSVLIDGLYALQPDLVALQEVIKIDEYDQVIDLLGPQWSVAH
jgi:mRNA deadenylase 3'-5' endonuclease subunit Ccr4